MFIEVIRAAYVVQFSMWLENDEQYAEQTLHGDISGLFKAESLYFLRENEENYEEIQ